MPRPRATIAVPARSSRGASHSIAPPQNPPVAMLRLPHATMTPSHPSSPPPHSAIPPAATIVGRAPASAVPTPGGSAAPARSEEHTSELQSLRHLVCRLLL